MNNDRHLPKAPLIYTLAVVHFTNIQKIADYIPDLQDSVRDRFPIYEEKVGQIITVDHRGGGINFQTEHQREWNFMDAEKVWGFSVSASRLFIHTVAYDSSPSFLSTLQNLLEELKRIARVSHCVRLGIRYIDAIIPLPGEKIEQYIDSRLCSYKLEGIESVGSSYVNRYNTQFGELILRSSITKDDVPVPPDLRDTAFRLASDYNQIVNGKFAILDTDHFVHFDKPIVFEPVELKNRVDQLHRHASDAFRSVATPHAIGIWEGGEP